MAKKINVKGPIVGNDIGWCYHWLGWDCCCPNDIEKGLSEAGGEDVILEINSPGGYCDVGSEIYTLLMKYEGNVEAHIMAAASAASVIACAADRVLASDTMVYMIHNAHGSGSGDYRDLMNVSEALEKYNESIINAYVRKTGKSREDLHQMMDHTTWMSAADAIEHGFADDYLFGNPEGNGLESNEKEEGEEQAQNENSNNMYAMNAATVPIISQEKAMELCSMIKLAAGARQSADGMSEKLPMPTEIQQQNIIAGNDSDIAGNSKNSNEGGKITMTLQELLQSNPEALKEYEDNIRAAKEDGTAQENARLKELDDIASSVIPEDLAEAKYGENRMDAKSLAYQALVDDGKKAKSYMADAIQDSKDAGVNDVNSNASDSEETKDESDFMASVANEKLKKR